MSVVIGDGWTINGRNGKGIRIVEILKSHLCNEAGR